VIKTSLKPRAGVTQFRILTGIYRQIILISNFMKICSALLQLLRVDKLLEWATVHCEWGGGDRSNKLCQELVEYFTLIRHGPNRQRRLQLLFIVAGKMFTKPLPSKDTQTHKTDGRDLWSTPLRCGQSFVKICLGIQKLRVFVAPVLFFLYRAVA
jgi:hypothetical protein